MEIITLKEIRIRKKMSRKNLAKLSNVSEAYLSMIENGKRVPTIKIINNIANALGCTPNKIFLSLNFTKSEIKEWNKMSKAEDLLYSKPPIIHFDKNAEHTIEEFATEVIGLIIRNKMKPKLEDKNKGGDKSE